MDNITALLTIVFVAVLYVVNKIRGSGSGGGSMLSEAPPAVRDWTEQARSAAREFGIPWEIVLAQIWQESWGDPSEIGDAGEIGLMQIKPIAIEDLRRNGYGAFPGWDEDPAQNIRAGVAYLDLQLRRSGRLHSALASTSSTALESYNEGYAGAEKDLGPDEYAQEVLSKAKAVGYGS